MSIHIKPENKGKFTALKKRTGHSATWFKQHGTPAQKKMATFALNAKHWKHANGGNLFETNPYACGGNLFAYGAPIRNYGMEWNNKVDRLRALNSVISQIAQKVDSMSSGSGGFGGFGSMPEGSAGWGNVGKTPEGLTGNDAIASQSFAANEFGFADGGTLGGYNAPQQKSDLENLMHGFGVDKNSLNDMQSWMSSASGQEAMANFGENFKGFKDMFAGGKKACGSKLHCGGGNLFDYGGDFSNGLTFYNTGGTHEENPYEGVQVGTDNQGTPNLVEEGEVRYQDYIFSNRLSLDEDMAKKYNIPKKYADATFAYIAEKMGEESKEREYDPISQRGLRADMEKLRGAQEEIKAIKAQEEMMQQVQQIADELGVSPEDVIAGMQMQQEEAAQQEAMAQQQAMQQPTEEEMAMQQQEVPQQMMEEVPYALGGTLFDYQGMDFGNPQKTKRLNYSLPNTLALGSNLNNPDDPTKTYSILESSLSDADFWERYTKLGMDDFIQRFETAYDAAKTEEEKANLRKNFIKDFNDLQKSYAEARRSANPREFNKLVKKHQELFNSDKYKGNTHFGGVEKDLKKSPRRILKDSTNGKFNPDGYFQVETRARHWGSNEHDKQFKERLYDTLNERLNKRGVSYGILDDDAMRYNLDNQNYELYGLSEVSAPTVREEEIRSIYDDIPMGDNAPTYTSYEAIGESPTNNSPTTKTNNPQSPEQGTGKQPKVYNTNPNYSLLDFVPLWQYLTAGKPDYSQADALVDYTNRMPKPTYKPIGDFVQYHPFDRQYAANQLRAQTAAAMRNNRNISGGSRANALVANTATNMQAQLADAAMQRQADEANLAQRLQVAQFNRGTNQFNAEAFNRLELQRPYEYQLGLQARTQRAALHNAIDTAYSAAKSTNLNTFLNNMYNRRREAQDKAQLEWLTDRGVFGTSANTDPFLTQEDSFWNWLRKGNWRKFNKKTNG